MGKYADRGYLASLAVIAAMVLAGATVLIAGGGASSGAEPPKTAVATRTTAPATPTAQPTADPVTLDFARALDLGAIRDALAAYRREHGSFPSTGGDVVTLCAATGDVGCGLRAIKQDLRFDDGASPYWYASDGSEYTLIARASLEQPTPQDCPDALPGELQPGPLMCMRGQGE
jgi:hypothetical protein